MRIAVTGSKGFIGKNLCAKLRELRHDVLEIDRSSSHVELVDSLRKAEFVFHLAGVNRPTNVEEFGRGNVDFTETICQVLIELNPRPLVFASSTQAKLENPYGRSKRAAESIIEKYAKHADVCVLSVRFPNVFGKWSKPNYNSAVATFCDAIINNREYTVHDPRASLNLVYIDDAVEYLISLIGPMESREVLPRLGRIYSTTVGEVVEILREFGEARNTLMVGNVGGGLRRALYSTFVSFLPRDRFSYVLPIHKDSRGEFVEMLKTPSAGQFSYFTAHPGVTRGGHYHHSKTEKFLVIAGSARFRFRSLINSEKHELEVMGGSGTVVETIPGWTHDITNIGEDLLVVMLWANEIFDRSRPDTVASEI